MSERCEHHGDDLVLYCYKCRPSYSEMQSHVESLEQLVRDLWAYLDKYEQIVFEGADHPEHREIIASIVEQKE